MLLLEDDWGDNDAARRDWLMRHGQLHDQIQQLLQQVTGLAPQTSTAQAITANATVIAVGAFSTVRVAPNAAYTGIILAAGAFGGQQLTVINESIAADTLTMAASGTSRVADGTSCVIAGLRQVTFVWDSGTSLWYH